MALPNEISSLPCGNAFSLCNSESSGGWRRNSVVGIRFYERFRASLWEKIGYKARISRVALWKSQESGHTSECTSGTYSRSADMWDSPSISTNGRTVA
jgi:hypothetical protein